MATDYFAVFDEPRRAHLDDERLKAKFLEQSTALHPDRAHRLGTEEREAAHEQYVELNAAYQCLRNPRSRVRHFLELERGSVPTEIGSPPAAVLDLFPRITQACRDADQLLQNRPRGDSPLLQAQFVESTVPMQGRLRELMQLIESRRSQVMSELAEFDEGWMRAASESSARLALLDRLENAYLRLSYFDKWLSQLQNVAAEVTRWVFAK